MHLALGLELSKSLMLKMKIFMHQVLLMNKLKWTLNLQKYPATVITNLMTEKEVST